MEDDSIESSGGSGFVAIALAILAVLVGGAGLYFGMSANQRLNTVNAEVEARSGTDARLQKIVDGLSVQVDELSARLTEQEGAQARQKTYGNMSERAIKALEIGIKEDREAIQKIATQITELGTRTVKTTAPVKAEASSNSASVSSSSGASIYVIESGDTFARIASKVGVSLQTILDLNPEVDPRRLRIGQAINLPSN
jgi:LysM repeat protein